MDNNDQTQTEMKTANDDKETVKEPSVEPVGWLQWIERHAKAASGIRDGLLAIAGTSYLLGYAVWSYNAKYNHLGFLPANQAQYLLAGAVPVLLLIFAWLLQRYISIRIGKITEWIISDPKPPRRHNTLRFLVLALGTTSSLLKEPPFVIIVSVIFMSVVWPAVIDASWYKEATTEREQQKIIKERTRTALLLPCMLTLIAVPLYCEHIYPSIPSEYGGPAIRQAYLDITRAQVSIETRKAILSSALVTLPSTPTDPSAVTQTIEVDVLYDGSDVMFIRPHIVNYKGPLYQIKKSTVQNVTWIP